MNKCNIKKVMSSILHDTIFETDHIKAAKNVFLYLPKKYRYVLLKYKCYREETFIYHAKMQPPYFSA